MIFIRRIVTQLLASIGGFAAALTISIFLVEWRYRWIDPNDVLAAGAMFAFGDLLMGLFLFALLSAPSTLILIRLLQDSDRFWSTVSLATITWGGLISPLLAIVLWVPNVVDCLSFRVGGFFLFLHFLSVLNCFAAPGILLVMVAAWAMCRSAPIARRRLLWGAGFEFLSLIIIIAWWVRALSTSYSP